MYPINRIKGKKKKHKMISTEREKAFDRTLTLFDDENTYTRNRRKFRQPDERGAANTHSYHCTSWAKSGWSSCCPCPAGTRMSATSLLFGIVLELWPGPSHRICMGHLLLERSERRSQEEQLKIRVSFVWWKCSKTDCNDAYTILLMYSNYQMAHLKRVNV